MAQRQRIEDLGRITEILLRSLQAVQRAEDIARNMSESTYIEGRESLILELSLTTSHLDDAYQIARFGDAE